MRYRPRLAWIRYGSHDLTDEEIQEAAGKFRVAIIQPWELKAAETLKELDSDVIVLAYQCLSSVRVYEKGPIYSSYISPGQADHLGFFALNSCRRRMGRRPGAFPTGSMDARVPGTMGQDGGETIRAHPVRWCLRRQ